ncbi:hypothetical protein BKA62DRAFT_725027 [Auriculariales sp. MPI-PUGE-AT-0066]|nr:hypothetical protein BKA62DRAFT_725027 [Auriculariales sp. MPI-PUGE-AT-0066]
MLSNTLLPLVLAAVAGVHAARPTPSPNPNPTDTNNPRLVGKRFPYAQVPYMADTFSNERGVQIGYNQCNSSTVGPESMCQTLVVNKIDDFCLYIPWVKDKPVGDAEAGMVAACTSEKWGARLIPQGALKSIQFLNAKSYIAIAGRIDGTLLNFPAATLAVSSTREARTSVETPSLPGAVGTMTQAILWNVFVSDGIFCIKMCRNDAPNALDLCEHVYDTQGCGVNLPAAYVDGVFETCDSDDMAPVNPAVTAIPASSNCVPVQSADIYKSLPTVSGGATSTATSGSSTNTGTSGGASGTKPGSTTTSSGTKPTTSTPAGAAAGKLVGAASLWTGMVGAVVAGLVGAAVVA